MFTGFANERSAEYMVLNDLYTKVQDHCSFYYPFYFHKNRDDTQLSNNHKIYNLQLIVCFARRPKTDEVNSNCSAITFRESIFEHTNYFKAKGISSIIGAPLGTSIDQIGFGAYCQWFKINKYTERNFLEYIFWDSKVSNRTLTDDVILIDKDDIISLMQSAPTFSWLEIMELLRTWYCENVRSTGLYYGIPGQKPVFITYRIKNNYIRGGMINE